MPIRLPRLTWDLDCEPLGYPGLVITFWLNPPHTDDAGGKGKIEWDTSFNRDMAMVMDSVYISAQYTTNEQEELIEIPDAKAVHELKCREDFDPQILLWAARRYQEQRLERLRAESKN